MKLPDSHINDISAEVNFEEVYTKLRRSEKRMFSDDELWLLPQVPANHPHYGEWLIRKTSSEKLVTCLANKKKPLKILEAGCGNGWLSHKLSGIPESQVTGLDINFVELVQAVRTFRDIPNLAFICRDILTLLLAGAKFDVVIFAASIQYFSSAREIISLAIQLLKANGEIHILDSPFYKTNKINAARQRTERYFNTCGFPEMTTNYHHHSLHELNAFNPVLLYDPGAFVNKLHRNKNPFPWICIKKLRNDP